MILADLDRHARERPGERAVVEISADGSIRELTWAALKNDADRVAAALGWLGVSEGEPVAFQLPNRLEFVTIALGTLRAGAVCEPLMPIFRERELSFMLGESRARVLFVPGTFRGRDYAQMAAGLPSVERVVVLPDGYQQLLDTAPPNAATATDPRPSRPAAVHLGDLRRAQGRAPPLRRARPARPITTSSTSGWAPAT